MLGVCYMVHGDDVGLRLPPRIAPIQVVIVTIPNSKLSEEKAQMLKGMFFVSLNKNRQRFCFLARLFYRTDSLTLCLRLYSCRRRSFHKVEDYKLLLYQ